MNKKIKMIMSSISPKITTYLMYLYNFHRILDLKNPSDLNEKLQYLKLKTYYNNPTITQCVDKYLVRDYLVEKGFSDILPQLLGGGYKNAEDIRTHWDEYPSKFVIKCNHGCGYNILVTDKEKANLNEIIQSLNQWIHEDFWKIYCEPQYRFVPKRIIVEEYLADDIQTYKFYCFNGKPEVAYVSSNGENGEKDLYLDYFDMEWNWLPITLFGHEHDKREIKKPCSFEQMKKLAERMSADFPFVRVDLYDVNGRIFFSELTFIPTGGNMKLSPDSVIKEWGNKLKL